MRFKARLDRSGIYVLWRTCEALHCFTKVCLVHLKPDEMRIYCVPRADAAAPGAPALAQPVAVPRNTW